MARSYRLWGVCVGKNKKSLTHGTIAVAFIIYSEYDGVTPENPPAK